MRPQLGAQTLVVRKMGLYRNVLFAGDLAAVAFLIQDIYGTFTDGKRAAIHVNTCEARH